MSLLCLDWRASFSCCFSSFLFFPNIHYVSKLPHVFVVSFPTVSTLRPLMYITEHSNNVNITVPCFSLHTGFPPLCNMPWLWLFSLGYFGWLYKSFSVFTSVAEYFSIFQYLCLVYCCQSETHSRCVFTPARWSFYLSHHNYVITVILLKFGHL